MKIFCVILIFLSFSVPIFFSSCKKDAKTSEDLSSNTDNTGGTTTITFSFTPIVNNSVLKPSSYGYLNTEHDTFSITKLNYYISNIRFKKTDGTYFSEDYSYHLIQHVEGINTFTVNAVPTGTYSYIEFLIGVDSLHNVSGAKTGALDETNHMFWNWNQGYIFFKFEGEFGTFGYPREGYTIHIGGFKGKFSCIQKCTFNLSNPIQSQLGKASSVTCNFMIDEIFVHPRNIGFGTYYSSVSDSMFNLISQNYKDCIVIDKISN